MKLIALLAFLPLAYFAYPQKAPIFTPSFTISDQPTHKVPEGQAYTFGYLEVLENRAKPTSNTIKLPIYIFKSRSKNPKPDPIIYTVGGPGYTSMRAAQYMKYYQYLDDRDLILFEQRGTQYAQPHLACPEWAEAVYYSNLPAFDETQSDSLFAQAATQCRARLEAQGIDLNAYHTNAIAADIADLRKVLGIDQYNLLTISYSTKIAQVLMRDYPKGIRSVVMDSPLPLEWNYDEVSNANLLAAVEKLLDDCAASEDCNSAFPNLKERFFNYLAAKTAQPLELTIDHPTTGTPQTFYLKGKDLIRVFTAFGTGGVPNIPLEMHKILENDLSSVKEMLAEVFNAPGKGNGKGMRLSVWCAEEFPFVSQAKVVAETQRYPAIRGQAPAVFSEAVCNAWKVAPAAAIENEPVQSDIPVLFISGEYDNETPPHLAVQMQKNFPNSFHLLFKGWKHTPTTNWGNPCAMQAANDFFNQPDVQPHPECFEAVGTPVFKTK